MNHSPVASGAEPLSLTQRLRLSSYLGLSLKNGLLNLVTLTLFRFWGKTEVRRRVWGSLHINDEPLEYTGRGVELFLGFLFAVGLIGLPFLLAVFGAQFLGPAVAGLILLPLYLLLAVLVGYGRFTAFRYIASRTAWRGIRFQLTGSPVRYGFKWLGYAWLSGLTLGWFWPAAQRRLAAPLWGGLRFGDREFRFDLDAARREKVYGAYTLGWVGGIVGYLVLAGVFVAAFGQQLETGAPREPSLQQIGLIYLVSGIGILGYAVLFAPYHAAALRSVAAGVSFDGVQFRLKVRWFEMAWMTISNIVLLTFSLGFLMPFVEARTSRFLVTRLETEGAVDFSTIRQGPDTGPRTGEGLADAFGMVTV